MFMTLIQWGKERERVLEMEKGRVMGVAIFAGKWGIGPGNVLATPRDLVREVRAVRALVRTGKIQANPVLVREVRDLGRTGRGQGMGKGVMVKVLGTKVHVSIVGRWGTRLQSAYTHKLLRRRGSLRLQVQKVR